MSKRRLGNQGRVTLPKHMLDELNIKKDDILSISTKEGYINIKKYTQKYHCVITGKSTKKGKVIGKSFISEEGLQLIKKEIGK